MDLTASRQPQLPAKVTHAFGVSLSPAANAGDTHRRRLSLHDLRERDADSKTEAKDSFYTLIYVAILPNPGLQLQAQPLGRLLCARGCSGDSAFRNSGGWECGRGDGTDVNV